MKNETHIFRPNKLKNMILLVGSSISVALGFIVLDDDPKMFWLNIIFFGLGVIVSLIQFYPNSTYLKLDKEGFEIKHLFRSSFTKWSEIKDLTQGQVGMIKVIFFDYTDEHKKWCIAKIMAKNLAKKEGTIMNLYNIKTDELLRLMKEYKRKSK